MILSHKLELTRLQILPIFFFSMEGTLAKIPFAFIWLQYYLYIGQPFDFHCTPRYVCLCPRRWTRLPLNNVMYYVTLHSSDSHSLVWVETITCITWWTHLLPTMCTWKSERNITLSVSYLSSEPKNIYRKSASYHSCTYESSRKLIHLIWQ